MVASIIMQHYGPFLVPDGVDVPEDHMLRGMFFDMTDCAMRQEGVDDSRLSAYVSDMLSRFNHIDCIRPGFETWKGYRKLATLSDMYSEVQRQMDAGEFENAVAVLRHIGDYALFIGGFSSTQSRHMRNVWDRDCVRYRHAGEGSYWRAFTISLLNGDHGSLTDCFEVLSENFGRCPQALGRIGRWSAEPSTWRLQQLETP